MKQKAYLQKNYKVFVNSALNKLSKYDVGKNIFIFDLLHQLEVEFTNPLQGLVG